MHYYARITNLALARARKFRKHALLAACFVTCSSLPSLIDRVVSKDASGSNLQLQLWWVYGLR